MSPNASPFTRATLVILVLAVFLAGRSAFAQPIVSFTVNATYDAVDASPGDGACGDATGACTLRAAVMESNALPGLNSIDFGGTLVLTIPGTGEDAAATGDLDVTDSLGITGDVIDGGGLDRVFDVDPTSTGAVHVSFAYVTIRNGSTSAAAGTPDDRGGGILNRGSASLFFANVVDSEADKGGGVFNQGKFETAGPTEIRNNRSAGTPASAGGGIYNTGSLDVRQGVVEGNSSSLGGGIFNSGQARFQIGRITANSATISGGGVSNEGTITITESTINGNSTGLGNTGSDVPSTPSGTATLTNSTISGNTSTGIVNGGNLSLTNVTIAENGGTGLAGGPVGTISLKNTIVGKNAAADCSSTPSLISLGHNLDSDGSCRLAGPGDISNVDPKLGPLTLHSTPYFSTTFAHALLTGSPAIDAGDNNGCPFSDQRGVQRPQDGNGDGIAVCDIGAFEADAIAQTPVPTPEPTAGPTPTPVLPADVPRTGGPPGEAGLPFTLAVAALPALIGAAALFRRFLRRR